MKKFYIQKYWKKCKWRSKKVKNKLVIVEIPLLVEKNLAYLFDRAIIVQCNAEKQLERLKKRDNIDKNQAKMLINAQTSAENRQKLAEQLPVDVIENNSEIFEMAQKVKDLYQKLVNL